MSLQINLFSDESIIKQGSKVMAPLSSRAFNFYGDISVYEKFEPTTEFEMSHMKNILDKKDSPRTYNSIYGLKMDSHVELEKAGLTKDIKRYRVIITLEDCLDFVISSLVRTEIKEFKEKLPIYQAISRGILNQDWDILGRNSFDSLIGISDEFDKYLHGLLMTHNTAKEVLFKLFKSILSLSQNMVSYIAMYLKLEYEKRGISLIAKSRTASTIVLSSDVPVDETIILNGVYAVYIKSYAVNEYIKHINENTSGGFLCS